MIKKFSALVLLLISTISWAQDNTASPYSYYGLGEIKFKGTHDVRAMGGVSVFNDSLQLNIVNPASFSKLKSTIDPSRFLIVFIRSVALEIFFISAFVVGLIRENVG